MISQISLGAVIAVLMAVAGLFFVIRSFVMPKSFAENEIKREDLRKKAVGCIEEGVENPNGGEGNGSDTAKSA